MSVFAHLLQRATAGNGSLIARFMWPIWGPTGAFCLLSSCCKLLYNCQFMEKIYKLYLRTKDLTYIVWNDLLKDEITYRFPNFNGASTLNRACDFLSMLRFKLIDVCRGGPWSETNDASRSLQFSVVLAFRIPYDGPSSCHGGNCILLYDQICMKYAKSSGSICR